MTTTDQQYEHDASPQALATWARLAAVRDHIRQLKAEEEEIAAALRGLPLGAYQAGGQPVFTIAPQRKFSADAARAVLTAQEIAACTVTQLDRAAVERTVSPDRYQACQAESGRPVIRAAT